MPTILMVQGWRFFFYANEGNEPMHVHAVKGDADCKYWIYADFDEICAAWRGRFGGTDVH